MKYSRESFSAKFADRRRIEGCSGLSSQASMEELLLQRDRCSWLFDATFLVIGIAIGVVL